MFVAVARGVWNLLKLPFLPLWWVGRAVSRPRSDWLHVKIRPRVVEFADPRRSILRLLPGFQRSLPTSLATLRRLAEHAGRDKGVRGVVFTLPRIQTSWAMAEGLREVLQTLRDADRRVAVFLPDGAGHQELFVASAAHRVLMPPQASVVALGLAAEVRYYKGLLDKVGVGIEPFAREEYKTAVENLAHEGMSDPQREQLGALLDTIDGALREALAGRGLSAEAIDEVFAAGMLRGPDAIERGLVDAVCYEDELPMSVSTAPVKLSGAGRYLAFKEARFFGRMLAPRSIGVVELHGGIGPGRRTDTVVASLRMARRDPRVRGVILHVDSPGGSALTSDLIHREIVRLREKKPVVACFSGVAASGGYYIGVAADTIVAEPTTITGSIGVVAARLIARQFLQDLGVRTEVVRKAPHADMFSPARDMAPEERAILDRELDGVYAEFVKIVAEGRDRSAAEIESLARGRVWSGKDAFSKGLVDRLGGMTAAIDEVQKKIGAGDLPVRLLIPRRLDVPPAEPKHAAAQAALAVIAQVAPSAAAAIELSKGGDRVLMLAPGVPEIR